LFILSLFLIVILIFICRKRRASVSTTPSRKSLRLAHGHGGSNDVISLEIPIKEVEAVVVPVCKNLVEAAGVVDDG
jgi:hypothetical protein